MNDRTLQLLDDLMDIAIDYGLDVIGAIVILVIGWTIAGWIRRMTLRGLDRMGRMDATIKPILANMVRYVILLFVVIAVLARFGVETTSIIAVFGAAGLAVGLALQGTLSNIAAGVMLLTLRPFSVGETIDSGGINGTVQEVGLFTTTLRTSDGLYISAPNSTLWGATITNFSRNPTRRIQLVVGVSYDDDLDGAAAEMKSLMTTDDRVLKDPEPQVLITELGASSVNLTLRCWTETCDSWQTQCDLTRAVKLRLDETGYSLPFPQMDVHMVDAKTP
ncbi:MAG: mechanosensitive ion channel family protein [Alphaproteobacteria bacterium]